MSKKDPVVKPVSQPPQPVSNLSLLQRLVELNEHQLRLQTWQVKMQAQIGQHAAEKVLLAVQQAEDALDPLPQGAEAE